MLPTTHIYAALIILVLGVMLGKFFLWGCTIKSKNIIHPLSENLRHGPPILFQTFQFGQWYFEKKNCHCKSDIFVNPSWGLELARRLCADVYLYVRSQYLCRIQITWFVFYADILKHLRWICTAWPLCPGGADCWPFFLRGEKVQNRTVATNHYFGYVTGTRD